MATDMYKAGGIPLVAKRLKEAGLLHQNELTVTGKTIGAEADAAHETAGQEVVRPLKKPLKESGGLVILKGNPAPEGCGVKGAGPQLMKQRGAARVFKSEKEEFRAGSKSDIQAG